MSTTWILKTRQMSEAGKEILLRQALATHMRSSRDRKLVMSTFEDRQNLEDIISYFGAFYLYNYQGVKLLQMDATQDMTIEEMEELTRTERAQLEIEVRHLLGEKLREEVDVLRLASEFIVELCDTVGTMDVNSVEVKTKTLGILKKFLAMIPPEYCHNNEIDFINEVTGWGANWRNEIYVKASGLKESAMSLREELLKTHDHEVAETSVLKQGISAFLGQTLYLEQRPSTMTIPDTTWDAIVDAIMEQTFRGNISIPLLKNVHETKVNLLELLESELESPTTLEEYEQRVGSEIASQITELVKSNPSEYIEIISQFIGMPSADVSAHLRQNHLSDVQVIIDGLATSEIQSDDSAEQPTHTKEELEQITRRLRTLEKIEHTLEKPVKGMLRAKGLRAAELDKITLDLLVKDRDSLVGIEIEVLETLKKKLRVPPPEDIKNLMDLRAEVQSGAIGGKAVTSSTEIGRKLQQGESLVALRLDLVWHFTISILKNISRVIEIYLRSKQDLLRCKAILKSIYEDSETEMQFLREEVLIDLASMRLYELKVIHPQLDSSAIRTWFHARLLSTDLDTARKELESTPSPVFEGVVDVGLKTEPLTFDNYSIAFDLMQRFIEQQKKEKLAKEEFILEVKREKQKRVEAKKGTIDVFSFIYTKAHTVFRAIGRVGARGLEWTGNDDAKCANLLAYFLNSHRGKPVCAVCGETPSGNKCSRHGKGNMNESSDIDSLSLFVMRAFTDIKEGLLGAKAEPMKWDEARSKVQRELSILKRRGKITRKTNVKALLPGEINHIVGPAIALIIGKYFNESLEYAARRANIA